MGLMTTLNIGVRGLTASQLDMDIAGQNISNADVEGYSRKRAMLETDYRPDSLYGQIGTGVDVISIERMRDIYIDLQIQRQNQQAGYFEEIDYALERVENIYTEPGDTGLLYYMDQFFDSWQNLANNPSDLSARTMVRTNAEILIDVFHNLSGEMRDLRLSVNDQLERNVERINQISREIFNLNEEVAEVEINQTRNANDSRDKRDMLLKELSQLIDISVTENERGQISVSTGGTLIVSPVYYQNLETTTTSFKRADGTSYTDIGIRFATSKRPYIPQGGKLKGLFETRDTIIPQYDEKLDLLATTLAQKVNELHVAGFNLLGYSGLEFFDSTMTGAADIRLSAPVASNIQNIASASGGATLGDTDSFTVAPFVNFGNPPVQLSHRNIAAGTPVVTVGGQVLRENVDYHIDYTLGRLQMLHAGYDNQAVSIDYQYSTGAYEGPGSNGAALAIAQLRGTMTMNPDQIGNPRSTFTEYYSAFIGKLGLDRNEAASNLETRNFLIEQYQTQQDAIAGVSIDEEMADMVKYQHTYQAAARLISTVDEMLDILMNMV